MPSLLQKVQQGTLRRDSTGQLTQETPEELNTLASKAGLQAPPITPLGAQSIGASDDVAKMAGTPAQKNAALTQGVGPSQSLQDTLRRNQGNERQAATGAESESMQKSRDLQNMGGLGDRVASFIDVQRAKLQAATQKPVEVQAAEQFHGKDISAIKPLLAQLRADPQNQQLLLQVNQALGYDTKTQLDPSQIDQLYQSSVDAIAKGGAGNVANDLTVEDLTGMKDFGYDKAELAHLLGVPEDQVGHMNIQAIRDRINQINTEEFSNTQKLEQQAQSGQLGAAERALARTGAREASRVGTRSSEADMQHLEQQIAQADQVQFGGKSYSVEDLLKDDTMSGIISDYLNMAPGSPERTQLEQTEPGLVQFIQKNQNLLQDASEQLQKGAGQFQETQQYNQQLVSNLPPNLAKLVAPEAGSLQAGKIDVSQKPLLQFIQQNPDAAQHLQGIDDRDAQAVAALNGDQLGQLFANGGQVWKQYQQDRIANQQMQNRLAQAKTPDQVVGTVFQQGGPTSYGQLQHDYQYERNRAALGLPNKFDTFQSLRGDHDRLLSPDELKAKVGSQQQESLQDALAGNRKQPELIPAPKVTNENSWSPLEQKISNVFSGKIDDGLLSRDEVLDSTKGFSDQEIREFEKYLDKMDSANLIAMEGRAGGLKAALEKRIEDREMPGRIAAEKAHQEQLQAERNRASIYDAMQNKVRRGQKLTQSEYDSLSNYEKSILPSGQRP